MHSSSICYDVTKIGEITVHQSDDDDNCTYDVQRKEDIALNVSDVTSNDASKKIL